MIKKAYIILVHKNPQQVYRLLEKLDDGNSIFFIHLDKRTSIKSFRKLDHFQQKLKFVEREKTGWGSFGLVTATINALKEVKKADEKFDQVILLSGQDYPIKSNLFIDTFFKESGYSIFIEYFTIPNYEKWEPRGGLYRVDKYYLGHKLYQKYTAKTLNFLSGFFSRLKRNLPDDLIPYAGSQWWMINMHAVNYILEFIEQNPDYVSFHKFTFAADEVFFHTILLNASDELLHNSIAKDSKRFLSWKDSNNAHPDVLTVKDLTDLKNSTALFARKFDERVDSKIFNLIDDYCLLDAHN